MQILVVGSGRSGTSMIARMLSLCGLYLGEEKDVRNADQTNAKGSWEHGLLNVINDRLLTRLGGSYTDPPLLFRGWEHDPGLSGFYDAASELINKTFAGHDNWGWKMPRAAFTIPFWRKVVPSARFVICLRNPADYVSSLVKYERFPPDYCYALWLRYNFAILVMRPAERFITSYEDYFPDFKEALAPLLSFVGLPVPEAVSEADAALAGFHSPNLKHHASGFDELMSDPDVPRAVKELYSQLRMSAPSGGDIPVLAHYDHMLPFLKLAIESRASEYGPHKDQRIRLIMRAVLRALTMSLAPRTRLRRCLTLAHIENGWTRRYDMHVAEALERDRLYTL